MIYLEMYGRLGNQFFRYATARALQMKYYPDEELSINFQQINEANKRDISWYNVLSDFNVHDYQIYNKGGKVIFDESSLKQKMVCILYYLGMRKIDQEKMLCQVEYEKKWQSVLSNIGVYWFRRGGWEIKKSKYPNKFLSGNFEDPIYFDEIRDILIKEFKPIHPLLPKNKKLFDLINTTESVCLSVRRGDFESKPDIAKIQSVCHKDYFNKAIIEIKKYVKHPIFFMFSDDIQWVYENIDTGCETYYEDGTDPVWEKLRLMSSCKHFIVSNSTFSWWAQYLSQNPDKIVISPDRWFNNGYKSPLIGENWIKIQVK